MKVAILGTENSHADAFAKLIRDDSDFKDIELVGAYGYDDNKNKKLAEEGLISVFSDTPHEFLDKVDAVLVTARHGDHHYEYALPYIQKGIHAFIDKPFTVKPEYSDELLNTAEKTGALLCGGSSLKFLKGLDTMREFAAQNTPIGGYVGAPINMVNDYAGFYFYSQHLIELMFGAFGSDVKAVTAYCPDETQNRVSVIADYGAFDVMAQYTSSYAYNVTVYSKDECKTLYTKDLGNIYKAELTEFAEMVRTHRLPHAYSELKKPVTILAAIEKSFKTQKKVALQW